MPDTHIKPRRPKSYFNPEHVSDNSEPDTDVEDLQLDANSSPVSLTSSECSSEESDPASEPPSEAGEALFSPSLNTQRHQMVLEILSRELIKSVLDLQLPQVRQPGQEHDWCKSGDRGRS